MRIFIGTCDIGGQISLLASGFRRLGHDVTTGVFSGDVYIFDTSLQYDISLRRGDQAQVQNIIDLHDIFIFQFSYSLLPQNRDFRMIRAAGKKIVAMHYGSDVRYWPACEQELGICYERLTGEDVPYFWHASTLNDRLSSLRRSELFANVIVSYNNSMQCALRPYVQGFMIASFEKYIFNVSNRNFPVVVHAPSKMQTKGTKLILQALDELEAEGVKFELRLLHNVSNAEVLEHLANADCVVDQALLPLGLFAVEAMASGCAAATASFPEVDSFDHLRPVHRLTPYRLKEQLRVFLTDRALRLRLAHEGRTYALQYHSPEYVCQRILNAVTQEDDKTCDCHPSFFACNFELPPNVRVAKNVRALTDKVVKRCGIPSSANILDMICKGLVSTSFLGRSSEMKHADAAKFVVNAGKANEEGSPSTTSILALLDDVDKFSLCRQFFGKTAIGIPRGLSTALFNDNIDEAVNVLVQTKLDVNGLGALVALLWGKGLWKEAMHLSDTLPCEGRNALLNWIMGVSLLEWKRTGEALKFLIPVVKSLPFALHGSIEIGEVLGSNVAHVVSWRKPVDVSTQWVSISAILPDWCGAAQRDEIILSVIMYVCAMQGFAPKLSNSKDYTLSMLQHILKDHSSEKC